MEENREEVDIIKRIERINVGFVVRNVGLGIEVNIKQALEENLNNLSGKLIYNIVARDIAFLVNVPTDKLLEFVIRLQSDIKSVNSDIVWIVASTQKLYILRGRDDDSLYIKADEPRKRRHW